MNLNNFVDQSGRYLQSAPVPVRLAGFESNTLKLFQAGWQMSIETHRHMYLDGVDVRVAFKHDGIKQVAMGIMSLDRNAFRHEQYMRQIFAWGIDINYIAPRIMCSTIPLPGQSSASFGNWMAVDPRPEFARIEKDLSDFALFKPIKADPDFEIYIHEKDEKEILDILLKKQDVRQKEIRQNQKRRAYQAGNQGFNKQDLADDINTDIKHQIVLVA